MKDWERPGVNLFSMLDPCALPETGWGWFSLITIALAMLGLGVAFVALPRRSWLGLVAAVGLAVVGLGAPKAADAQAEEQCYSVKIVNSGTADWTGSAVEASASREKVTVCEFEYVPVGLPTQPIDNCVVFEKGAAIGEVKWLKLTKTPSMIAATQGGLSGTTEQPTTGVGIWTSEPTLGDLYEMMNSAAMEWSCSNTTTTPTYTVSNGDTVWVGTNSNC